ncbi:MAG: Glyoxalase-like domain protein [Candidatus Kaiserbacteria bacterium]|nr:Glyoxalase-like domain protein [Candidatus Kaiserbacteria bacterium]
MKLDAIGVVSKDIKKSVAFYKLLGFEFGEVPDDAMHIEAKRQNDSVRFMIDNYEMIKEHTGIDTEPSNMSSFAILCDNPADVDSAVQKIKDAGYTIAKEPWDAMWGQRYAVVIDPDGYGVDLFATL